MQPRLLNEFPDLSELVNPALLGNAFAATRELVQINNRLLERYIENQIGLANLCVEGGEKQLQVNSVITNPQDFTQKQSALYEEYRERFAEVTGNQMKLAQDAGEEYAAWFKRNLNPAQAVRPKTVKTVKKSTSKKAPA